jgi:endonuclease III-like uncharacterized protein
MKVPVHAPGVRHGETGQPWRGKLPPPGKHWQYLPSTLDEMDARGEIYWSPTGNPRRKVYLDESEGVGVQDIWLDLLDAHNQNIKITGYPTEKNPELLRRIIQSSSNEGDLVLDSFSGSGTALAVAHELNRKWIGIDNSVEAIDTTLHRFTFGLQPMGDYVKRDGTKGNDEPGQQSLFDSLKETDPQVIRSQHRPILEFELSTTVDREPELRPTLLNWRTRIHADEKNVFTVRETPGNGLPEMYLSARDQVLEPLIQRFGSHTLKKKTGKFSDLLHAVASQQLSFQAASSITNKIRQLFDKQEVDPERFLKVTPRKLRKAGLSQRKVETLRALARAIKTKSLDLEAFRDMTDEAISERLTKVKGIGAWTAEMFLMFALGREDVFPVHDTALQQTLCELYDIKVSSPEGILQLSDNWRPFRSVACWYLYKYKNSKKCATV